MRVLKGKKLKELVDIYMKYETLIHYATCDRVMLMYLPDKGIHKLLRAVNIMYPDTETLPKIRIRKQALEAEILERFTDNSKWSIKPSVEKYFQKKNRQAL